MKPAEGHDKTRRTPQAPWRLVCAGFAGTSLEYYDFFIYGTMAALVFKQLFFPSYSALAGTLASFGTFAVGFVARPLGSLLFGYLGDRVGRKHTLFLSLLMMGGSTVAIGVLPTFADAGLLAPVLLVLIRVVQGLALGGEWGGAALLLVESAPRERRSLMGSVVQMGAPGGLLLASAVTGASTSVAGDAFVTWGWRLPFLFSAILLGVAVWVRVGVSETPEFAAMHARLKHMPRTPITRLFRDRAKDFAVAFGIAAPGNAVFFLVSTYTLSYVTGPSGFDRSVVLHALLGASAIYLVAIPAFGWLADRIGERAVIGFGCIAALAFAALYFAALHSHSPAMLFVAMTLALALVHAALQAPQATFFASRFDVAERYTGVALSQAIPTTLVGGTVPLLAALFDAWTGDTALISGYVAVLAILGLASISLARGSSAVQQAA